MPEITFVCLMSDRHRIIADHKKRERKFTILFHNTQIIHALFEHCTMKYEKEQSRLKRADKFITKPEYEIKNAE